MHYGTFGIILVYNWNNSKSIGGGTFLHARVLIAMRSELGGESVRISSERHIPVVAAIRQEGRKRLGGFTWDAAHGRHPHAPQ